MTSHVQVVWIESFCQTNTDLESVFFWKCTTTLYRSPFEKKKRLETST
jgi:hypothetical protein